jgi:hypothetical protein
MFIMQTSLGLQKMPQPFLCILAEDTGPSTSAQAPTVQELMPAYYGQFSVCLSTKSLAIMLTPGVLWCLQLASSHTSTCTDGWSMEMVRIQQVQASSNNDSGTVQQGVLRAHTSTDGKHPQADQGFFQRREFCFTMEGDIFVRYQSFKVGGCHCCC